ncbi:hypothetical protein [Microbacterium sp. CH12i]|nr:hypothetical protein [Microbacterium sp. CH12i]
MNQIISVRAVELLREKRARRLEYLVGLATLSVLVLQPLADAVPRLW